MGSMVTSNGTQHVTHMRVDKNGNVMEEPKPYDVETMLACYKGVGHIEAGCYSVLVRNIGKRTGYVLDCPLLAGTEIPFRAPDKYGRLPKVAFDASGTEFIVQYAKVVEP